MHGLKIYFLHSPHRPHKDLPPNMSPKIDESPSGDFVRESFFRELVACVQMGEICITLCPDLGKMIKIMVECRKFGQVGIEEC